MAKKKKEDNTEFEIAFYEDLVRKAPKFVEALACLGDLYTRVGRVKEGLCIDQRLARLRPYDSLVLYNLSCSYSLMGQIDRAFNVMKTAIERGYDDISHLEEDSDLNNLLASTEFREYLTGVRQRLAAHAASQ